MITSQEKTLKSMFQAHRSLRRHLEAADVVPDDANDAPSILTTTTNVSALTAFDYDPIIKATAVYQRCMRRRGSEQSPLNTKSKMSAGIAAGDVAADKALQAVRVDHGGSASPPFRIESAPYARFNDVSTARAYNKRPGYRTEEHDVETAQEDASGGESGRSLDGDSNSISFTLYDSTLSRGVDPIRSRVVFTRMDHLTVRSAQRNVRDSEILITLVRSAAETRHDFENMKSFIAEQDRKTMTSRDIHDTTTKYEQELPPSKDIAALRFKYLDKLDRDIRESTTNGPVALATVIEQA
jgi:hypothetical protein